MGTQQIKAIVTTEQRKEYLCHLMNDIKALDKMVAEDLFEKKVQRIGAEQEFCLVDNNFRPSINSMQILKDLNDPHFTTEMGLFNLEINLDPFILSDTCFSDLNKHLDFLLDKVHRVADKNEKNKVILTGILPTLRKKDISMTSMTPLRRYRVLNKAFQEMQRDKFKLIIKGVDELYVKSNTILFEICNTSFQVHLQIPLDEIIAKYNWAQFIAGPVLSVTTNSPLLLGRELHSETRIAVFQQSLDTRSTSFHLREQKPRVSFGRKWIKDCITEVYKDDISRYTPLVTSKFESNSLDQLKEGITPKLKALCLHNGTMYKWNRLCYGVTDGKPHFRIENRYLPAGPTSKDEIANALFWVGLIQGMPKKYAEIWRYASFNEARGNFINASRTGIDTYFNWFGDGVSAKKLLRKVLLPMARKGLLKTGINGADIDTYLTIIEERANRNVTGSKWMVRNYRKLLKNLGNDEANVVLTSAMHKRQMSGKPVHEWPRVKLEEGSGIAKLNDTLRKVMTTEIFVSHPGDPTELVKNIMSWKDIHHLPVVSKKNRLLGIITEKLILKAEKEHTSDDLLIVNDVMQKISIRTDPETTIEEAMNIMKNHNIDYLPVIENDELIGIFTKNDLKRILIRNEQ